MATGIEVVGVVLAVFPIVVDSMSRGIKQSQTIATAFRPRKFLLQLTKWEGKLKRSKASFEQTVEYLLLKSGIAPSEKEVRYLMNAPKMIDWRSPRHDKALRIFLDRSYDAYIESLEALHKAITSVETKLASFRFENTGKTREVFKRLMVMFKKTPLEDELKEIQEITTGLTSLRIGDDFLERRRPKSWRLSHRPAADFCAMRRQYTSLYRFLERSKYWHCACQSAHAATIRLENKPASSLQGSLSIAEVPPQYNFRLLLACHIPEPQDGTPAVWEELEVSPIGFSESVVQIRETYTERLERLHTQAPTVNDGNEILDFCATAFDSRQISTQGSLGYLKDDHLQHCRQRLHRTPARKPSFAVSLDSLIKKSAGATRPQDELLRRYRLFLAVVLASSVIQLGDTEWMRTFWTSADIMVPQQADSRLDDLRPNETYPYLSWELTSPLSQTDNTFNMSKESCRSRVVFALGLTLVELCLGWRLAELYTDEDIRATPLETKRATAIRLLDRIYQQEGEEYRYIVQKCVMLEFRIDVWVMDHGNFQKAMFFDVVEPLEDILARLPDSGRNHMQDQRI